MKPFKAKYTELVLYLAGKLPFLFTKRLRISGDHFLRSRGRSSSSSEAIDQKIKYASLFSERMVWKGVSLVGAVEKSDLRKLHRWMKSQKDSLGYYHRSHDATVESTDLVTSGWSHFGLVSFGPDYVGSVGKLSLLAELPEGCLVTILKLPKGVVYLSLYVILKDSASDEIFKVDVSDLESYVCFQSLNPFSPGFSIIEHHSRHGESTELIHGKARAVIEDARQSAAAVLQVCGIKKSISGFATAVDFCRDNEKPYFSDASTRFVSDESENVIYNPSRGRFLCSKICDDATEEYLERYITTDLGVDGVFIKSEVFSNVEKHRRYVDRMHSASECYTYILYVYEVFKDFQRSMNSASPVFSSYKMNSRKNLKVLIEASLQLNLVEERLKALQDGMRWSDEKYWVFTEQRIKHLAEKVGVLREDIDRRKELNNSELQLSNLIWTKRYSLLVLFLVFVQVALAMLVLDWSEEGRDRNPVYINLIK